MTEPPDLLHNGRISLTRKLGEGGMALVYEAYDHDLTVWRAVKFLRPELADKKGIRRRFLAEAQALAKLDHAHIVRVYDVGEQDGWPFLLMSLVRGGSLEDYLAREGRMGARTAARVMIDVCRGVQEAHDAGIVHRDIKPDNVLITSKGVAKVTDFGIAIVDENLRRTRTGSVMGTLGYMAPEQQRDAKNLGPTADVYALGATLFALVSGEQPTDLHMAATEVDMLDALDEPLRSIVARATSYRPGQRHPSAQALADDLAAHLDQLVDDTPPASLARPVGPTKPPPRSQPPHTDPSRHSGPPTSDASPAGPSTGPTHHLPEDTSTAKPLPYRMPARPVGATASDDYIDHEAEAKAQRKREALEKLRRIERRKRESQPPDEPPEVSAAATPAPSAPTKSDQATPAPAGQAPPSGEDLAEAAKEAADKTLELFLQALKPMWPGLIALALMLTIFTGLLAVGSWKVRGAANEAGRARTAFLQALDAEGGLVDDLKAMGARDDTVPVLHMQLMAQKDPSKRAEQGIDFVRAGRVTHEKNRFTTPAAMQHRVASATAHLEKLERELTSLERADAAWEAEATSGLGALAVNLGLAPSP